MDIKIVIIDMIELIDITVNLPEDHASYGKNHLREMCSKIINDEVVGEKAHRWIGYIQGCCCSFGVPLDVVKEINKRA